MVMKTAEAEGQKQQGASHDSAPSASQSASPTTVVAPPTTASVEGLQLLVQARLSVSSPNDPFEHEAESMADEFVKSIHGRTVSAPSSSAGSIARSVPDSGLVEGGGGLATTDDTASAIMSARAGGQALSGDVRARFEGFFGADLGGVKIHNDGTSDNLCRSINAEAFTTGNDVFFTSRNFKPGSSSGDHLLAHELTHVVQQGNAPALSRRAVPDIQREWYNPLSWGKSDEPKEEVAPDHKAKSGGLKSTITKGTPAVEAAGYSSRAAEYDLKDSDKPADLKAAGEAGEAADSFGLIACTATLFADIMQLLSEWNSESYASSRGLLIKTVKDGINTAKKSTTLAQAAGATIATSAIPGLGLAVNIIDLADQCIQLDDSEFAIVKSEKILADLREAAQFRRLEPKELKVFYSVRQLSESIKSQHKRVIVKMMADFVGMLGQVTLLSGIAASAGGVLVAVGAAVHGLAMLEEKVAEWSSAEAINESRKMLGNAELELKKHDAKKSGDPIKDKEVTDRLTQRVEDLTLENLGMDAYAAASELIKYCAGAVTNNQTIHDEAKSLLTNFDIDEDWLAKYAQREDKDIMLDKGAKIICRVVGKAPNPLALKEDVERAAIKAKEALKYVARGSGYFIFWSGKKIAHITVDVAEGIQDNVLTPLWNAATVIPGLIWNFFHKANEINKAVDAGFFSSEQPDYFSSEEELDDKCAFLFDTTISFYFSSLTKHREKARPEILTRLLKSHYEKLVETAKKTHTDGTEPYVSASQQVEFINEKIKVAIVRELDTEHLIEVPVSVKDGIVDFKYKDDEKTSSKEANNVADSEAGKPPEGNGGKWSREAFPQERHLQTRVRNLTRFTIEPYFQQKAARGTDVKPESVTKLLRSPYRSFVEAAHMTLAGRKPFASAAEQIKLINAFMEEEILYVLPERVDENSLSVKDGNVDFKYRDGGPAKTKGWFADFRGRQAV